jgi:hypothetical protein
MTSPIGSDKIQIITLACILGVLFLVGCGPDQKPQTPREAARPMKSINEVIKTYSDSLMTIPGVVGLYQGLDDSGRTCLKVMVVEKKPELVQRIPEWIEGYPVVIEETGEIMPMKPSHDQ